MGRRPTLGKKKMTAKDPLEFSRPVTPQSIGELGRSMVIEATREECARLALRLALNGLGALSADLSMTPRKSGRIIHLEGSFRADVTQTCVVTLEALSSTVEGTLNLLYDSTLEDTGEAIESFDIDGDDNAEVPLEPLQDGLIDIGEAVSEQLALEIDPFPRKPGVSFEKYSTEMKTGKSPSGKTEKGGGPKSSPFAELAGLKEKLKK